LIEIKTKYFVMLGTDLVKNRRMARKEVDDIANSGACCVMARKKGTF
jgi:hypothetical protein